MNLSRFFIDRPIFAGVVSVVVFLAGLVSLFQLPISEYPEVVPPTVVVKAQFPGTDPNLAQELVQNRVNQALPRLPDVTRQLGVTTVKSSPDLTMVVHLTSPDDRYDMLYLRNYAVLNVKDQLAKIPGVGSVQLFGSGDYAMRIWLNPRKVAEHGLTPQDVVAAVRSQNQQVSARSEEHT